MRLWDWVFRLSFVACLFSVLANLKSKVLSYQCLKSVSRLMILLFLTVETQVNSHQNQWIVYHEKPSLNIGGTKRRAELKLDSVQPFVDQQVVSLKRFVPLLLFSFILYLIFFYLTQKGGGCPSLIFWATCIIIGNIIFLHLLRFSLLHH